MTFRVLEETEDMLEKKNRKLYLPVIAFLIVLVALLGFPHKVQAKTISASLKETTLQVGDNEKINCTISGVRYSVSDNSVCTVSEKGVLTAKKQGNATLTIKASGYSARKFSVIVEEKEKMPCIPVAVDDVEIQTVLSENKKTNQTDFVISVKNHGNGKIKEAVFVYEISGMKPAEDKVENASPAAATTPAAVSENHKEKMVVTFKNIAENKSKKIVKSMIAGEEAGAKLKSVQVYSGQAVHSHNLEKDTYGYGWGTKDTKPPKITGWVEENSVCQGEPYQVCFSDRAGTYNFKKYVQATDERAGKVTLKVDSSAINWNKTGIYKVKYTATDKAGNQAKSWAKIQVYVKEAVDSYADQILSSITRSGWSDAQKARAIYSYVLGHCHYVNHGSHTDFRKMAAYGYRYQSGDCFTFYAMARELLLRAGIPALTITRYPLRNGAHHWWNLVYVQGGWYHLDATPRTSKVYLCLQTDSQLRGCRDAGAFSFVSSKYPARATKIISRNP